ncbi:hypothetical protein L6164_014228 [Bauhinia variegata]|uniref:Uncharacterized protein n=1 Tax=Bauhinia variegata TaxID=167791 RepID=A0ACB9NGV2_BAUVA|nr:hypothetical protein L6164_014228 [Bauhinia variegata]
MIIVTRYIDSVHGVVDGSRRVHTWISDKKNSTEKYTAAVSNSGGRPVTWASLFVAFRYLLSRMPELSISVWSGGNSQSRLRPSNPKLLPTAMEESMKTLRVAALEAIHAKTQESFSLSAMERRVFMGDFLLQKVFVKLERLEDVEGEQVSKAYVALGKTKV